MAGTTYDKLSKLLSTKSELKAALAEKGQSVGDVFSEYPDAVRAIETSPEVETILVSNANGTSFLFGDGSYHIADDNGSIRLPKGQLVIAYVGGTTFYPYLSGNYSMSLIGITSGTLEGVPGSCTAIAFLPVGDCSLSWST